ncbi:MAG: DoxX family protein [Thermomicrobium sp.]|nr:DoxX family protein [Thermomicrobium sp.]MDW7981212.1 DoxX family protein [Thermomicrobium sp.]
MDWAFLIGRVVFGFLFVFYAINHFRSLQGTIGYAASKNVPAPQVTVVVASLMMLLGGLSVIVGFQPVIGGILLIVFLVLAAYWMHDFWAESDPYARANQMAHFMKNIGLAGAALALLAVPTPWPLSLG